VVERGHQAQATVVINDRADIARLTGGDGVHVGQDDLSPVDVRRIAPGAIIGLSTHTQDQLTSALTAPIDYVAVGPIFETQTKESGHASVGLDGVRKAAGIAAAPTMPLVAIGGLTLDRAQSIVDAGADAAAVISDLVATGDPASRVREWLRMLG
jgi:thiamine-phosphate pyrophosphorylase